VVVYLGILFLKMTKVKEIIGLLLSTAQVLRKFGRKMGRATFWTIFTTNSSGHTAYRTKKQSHLEVGKTPSPKGLKIGQRPTSWKIVPV
jgi:hypothetical protein